MRYIFLALIGLGASACATPVEPSPNPAEQQVLQGARAGDQLGNGEETRTDGQTVGRTADSDISTPPG